MGCLTGSSDFLPSAVPSENGCLGLSSGSWVAAPAKRHLVRRKCSSRIKNRREKALFAKNKPLTYTNLHPSIYTLCIVYIHSISHWACSRPFSQQSPRPVPAGRFLNTGMTSPAPLGESPDRGSKEKLWLPLCARRASGSLQAGAGRRPKGSRSSDEGCGCSAPAWPDSRGASASSLESGVEERRGLCGAGTAPPPHAFTWGRPPAPFGPQ